MAVFVPGLELSRRLYDEVVAPRMAALGMPYAAGLLGRGSDVLGYDDATSTDHDWGPRLVVLLREDDADRIGAVGAELTRDLPALDPDHPAQIEVQGLATYVREQLAVDVAAPLTVADWLSFPEHVLAGLTAGAVHHDEVGLEAFRESVSYYPDDVWRYLLVSGWWRLHPEMNLVGRPGSVGDELGSAVIGARLVADAMHLCFLMERTYAPYSKWFGTAFSRLACGSAMEPVLREVLRAGTWQEREDALLTTVGHLVDLHNALGLTEPVELEVEQMWGRSFRAGWAPVPDLLYPQIEDPEVLAVAERWPVGPVDRFRELVWASRHLPRLRRVLDDPAD